jgi:hypothetical protein
MDFVYFGKDSFNTQGKNVLNDFKNRLLTEHTLNPKFAHMSFALAAVYSKLDIIDSCVFYLKDAIDNSPTWLYPRYLLIKKYRETGQKEKAFEMLNSVLEMDSMYKNYECITCFFDEAFSLIEDDDNYKRIDHLYRNLLKKDLLINERSLIFFYKYLNANSNLSYFHNIWNYHGLKKQIGSSFNDRMILLAADVTHEKRFLRDKKIWELLQFMDTLIAANELENYFTQKDYSSKLFNESDNRLFLKYFPTNMLITGYNIEAYLVFKKYIYSKLMEY